MQGTIVAAYGRQYQVELAEPAADEATLLCVPRGKKSEVAVGDQVDVARTSHGHGVIDSIAPRQSLLYRSNEFRHKLIAANVTQLIIVVAVEPNFSDELVTRCLVAAQSQDIKTLIVLNKADLADRLPAARAALQQFAASGTPVLELSALDTEAAAATLRQRLAGETSVLVGQSGMGKSTLINAIIPGAAAATREISTALDSGKHTTTHARLYRLDANSALIDSPGVQEFGLAHLERDDIEAAFPELRPHLGHCRFRDCRHDREPNCALQAVLAAGGIHPRRWTAFRALYAAAQ
jgi:ribosome biogenesis GTPase